MGYRWQTEDDLKEKIVPYYCIAFPWRIDENQKNVFECIWPLS